MNSSKEYIENKKSGILLSKNNSENLFLSAELLANNKFYGPAISILILSAEELIKSFALELEIMLGGDAEVKKISKEIKSKSSNSYLFNHQDKHLLAKALLIDLKSFSKVVNLMKFVFKGNLRKWLDVMSLPSSEFSMLDKIVENIKKFNSLKKEGLYVDEENGAWKTPMQITEIEYKSVLEDVSYIRKIFSPKIDHFLEIPNEDLVLVHEAMKK